ncbi:MAG: copper chaperone PCu(A)C, partial [Paracoccaceae bacterium]|nr:copper chaperone PCu(A)C [Paracoccaceae bacterium]
VQLAPGGLHVMFMGLGGDPFEVGETFPATLVFEKAGEVEVVFYVEERTAEAMDHSGHQMGN